MQDLKETTDKVHYENFRQARMSHSYAGESNIQNHHHIQLSTFSAYSINIIIQQRLVQCYMQIFTQYFCLSFYNHIHVTYVQYTDIVSGEGMDNRVSGSV